MESPRRILLHIGAMKTGTTSLQLTMALNRPDLAAASVLYSSVAGDQEHRLLALYVTEGVQAADLRLEAGLADDADFARFLAEFPDALIREVEASGCRTLVLSSEHLSSRVSSAGQVERLWALLRRVANEIRIVYYARPQLEMPFSIWSTMLKGGSAVPFDFNRILANRALDHQAVVARWGACCPDRDWILRPYQRQALASGDIIDDFCQATDLPPTALPHRVVARNQTLDAAAAEFLRLYNIACIDASQMPTKEQRLALVRFLEELPPGPPMPLPEDAAAQVDARFAAGNADLAARFLGRTALFDAPPAGQGTAGALPAPEDLARIAAAVNQWMRPPSRDEAEPALLATGYSDTPGSP